MGISGYGERDGVARLYVERLETALAAAKHERDLARERARLAGEGVAGLEQRLAGSHRQLERERGEAERELERHAAEAQERLGASEGSHAKELKELNAALAAQRADVDVTRARLELREEELERSRETAKEAQRELKEAREQLAESERELALRQRDLAARVRELGQAGDELIAREREVELAGERLAEHQRELDAARARLESQEAELARVRDATRDASSERDRARETARNVARERDEAHARLEARERHLANAKAGIESRDRRLEAAEGSRRAREADLVSREAEVQRLRTAAAERERRLALAETRLEKAQQRAEFFQGSLVELREGRAYRLMRVLWRLRRPFGRAPKEGSSDPAPAADEGEPAPAVAVAARRPPMPPAGRRLRVASILDEMSAACFAPECDLVPLSLTGWAEELDERPPDLLLVESAWNGNGGEWQYRIAQYPRGDLVGLPALHELLDGCRERGIPTAFWNKEDPVHFERFAEAAALFDHVFTTDAGCVERYRALPGRERTVVPLPFAAQPRIHNPAAVVPERSASPCFAGAWYRDRHPDRRRALEALLDAARPYGLVIYDRSFGVDDGAFGFPDRFAPHVLGQLPYERILDVYKSHRVFLNANSVVDSPTMCSRRVFELAACDTAILSTPGAALVALLGEGVVEEAGDEEAAAVALERLLGDEADRRRRTRAARRAVFAAHTYADRLATIAGAAGIDAPAGDEEGWELVLQPGVALAAGAEADLRAAATFADAEAIGAGVRNGAPAPEHRRVGELDPRALLLSRELIETRGRPGGSPEEIQARLGQWSEEGVRLYAADADLLGAGRARPPLVGGRS